MPAPNTKLGPLTTFSPSLKPLEVWTRAVADRVNGISPLPAQEGSNLTQIPGVGSTSITDPFLFDPSQIRLGVIQSTGPGGASNYTDNRYWWQEGMVVDNNNTSTAVSSRVVVVVNPGTWNASAQTLTNIYEPALSHSLAVGSVVNVYPVTGVVGTAGTFTYQQWVTLAAAPTASSSTVVLNNATFSGTLTNTTGAINTLDVCGSMSLSAGLWQIDASMSFGSGGASTITVVVGAITFAYPTTPATYESTIISYPSAVLTNGTCVPLPVKYLDNRTSGSSTIVYVLGGAKSSSGQDFIGIMHALKVG